MTLFSTNMSPMQQPTGSAASCTLPLFQQVPRNAPADTSNTGIHLSTTCTGKLKCHTGLANSQEVDIRRRTMQCLQEDITV